MFQNVRHKIVTLLSVLTLVAVPMGVPALASAQNDANANIQQQVCAGATLDVSSTSQCAVSTAASQDKANEIIKTVINIFSLVVGIVSVIMIIFGGLKYITSGGDSNNVSSAKNTIIYAVIGLVIVALAQFIVQFVLNKVTTTT